MKPRTADPEPRVRPWTQAEYHRLADVGFFHLQNVELLEGAILVKSRMSPPHAMHLHAAAEVLRAAFEDQVWVRQQLPLDLGPISEPEPDVSVVQGSNRDYESHHPKTALLCVEVSDSSLAYDRGRKGGLYARYGIPDYWILNLVERRLEVYREPAPDASQDYGFKYTAQTILHSGDFVSPVARLDLRLEVASFFA